MGALLKGLTFAALAALLAIPVGIALLAIGIPVLAVGGVIVGMLGAVAAALALPVLIVGGIVLGLLGAVFGIFAAILGLSLFALKWALIVAAAVLGLQFVARAIFGTRRKAAPALGEPIPDRYEAEARRELDRELGV